MVQDFLNENEKERQYYRQDFSVVKELINRIRESLRTNKVLKINDLDFKGILDYDPSFSYAYISVFQSGFAPIRWGANRSGLADALNRDIDKISSSKNFSKLDIANPEKCRIMIEVIIDEKPVNINDLQMFDFNDKRFEPGITGLKLVLNDSTYVYPPTYAWVQSQIGINQALNTLIRKTYIKDLTDKISERIKILKLKPHELYIVKSRAFVSYKDDIVPLYRGYKFNEYSQESLKDIVLNSVDWTVENMQPDGRFLYYYDCKDDSLKDHEHPGRKEDNLYYNDLRHCGGIVTLIRAYQLSGDKKYLDAAKKALDFIVSITKEHETDYGTGAYVYYNSKAKLGGTGVILIAMMKYRNESGDKSYDDYIKKYARHLISRIYKTGELLGYFIHPNVQDGRKLITMSDSERKETFSFYYPGEALLGLALFANYFDEDADLRQIVLEKSKLALDWIVDERPKIYRDLFTALPSDGWLMQAIEEWANNPDFVKDNYINFVYTDAKTMIEKTYKRDDSPYLDYEGGMYYEYGDHFYPDGARCEGLIAAYYLAKKLGNNVFAQEILESCRKSALCQMYLYNGEENIYAHLRPEKSFRSIRFKATRQWVRIDSVQHVACFFARLYFAENNIVVK